MLGSGEAKHEKFQF